jgi:hypothetical protein
VARIAYLGALSPTTLDPRQIEQFNVGLVENGANRSLVSRLAGYYCLENKAALNREAEG